MPPQKGSIRDLLDATFEDRHLKGLLALATAGNGPQPAGI